MKNLAPLATKAGHFTISAFDHRGSLQELLNPQAPDTVGTSEMLNLKRLFVKAFADISSAILIDPLYGLNFGYNVNTAKPENTGLLLSLEKTGYTETDQGRMTELLDNWSVADIKKNRAAAKILLYFHPDAPLAQKQLDLVKRLSTDCRELGVIFLIEPIVYGLNQFSQKTKTQATLETIVLLNPWVDILKLEFPLDVAKTSQSEWTETAQAISTAAAVPWILLSRGMAYEPFCQLTAVTGKNGASGIAVGRAVWQEIADTAKQYLDRPEEKSLKIEEFLMTTARERMNKLCEMVAANAKPWSTIGR